MNHDIEAQIAAELRNLADGVGTSVPLADGARRRARTIRARRRIAAVGLAAAVTAAAVPTAFSLGGLGSTTQTPHPADTGGFDEPTPSPSQSATPSPSPSDSPTGDPEEQFPVRIVVLSLDDLPAGDAPGVDWIDGEVLRTADGRELPIPSDVFDAAAFGDGVVGASFVDDGEGTILQAGDGAATRYAGSRPVMSEDDDLVAWYDEAADQVQVARADDITAPPEAIPGRAGMNLQPVGFLDDQTLVSNLVSPGTWPPEGARRDTMGGDTDTPWPALLEADAVSAQAQLVVGLTEVREDLEPCTSDCGPGIESRTSLFAADDPEPLWSTWEYDFEGFSPDGRHLVGTHAYRDGIGDGYAAIVDTDAGELVRRFDVGADSGGWLSDMVFEDNEHILLVLHVEDETGTRAAIVRCSISGACETATGVRELAGGDPFMRLDIRP